MAPKRKRAGNANGNDTGATDAVPQPSSRDASGEDTADAVLSSVLDKKEEQQDGTPARRTRATSKASTTTPKIVTSAPGSDSGEDEIMEDDDEQQQQPVTDTGKGENGEAGTMSMQAPPKAGLVDPVGYKTNAPPEGRAVRVYADGVFDLFHLGHMRQLQQAKNAFDQVHLIVGVTGDRETHRRKGLTVLSAKERAESVRHCRWVDEVVEDCPWVVTPEFLAQHSIDFVAHDDIPYGAAEGDDIYLPIKAAGQFLVTQRTEGVSTTGIITKIVRDYESYIARQLQRGESRKELNISWLKKNELDIKRHVTEIRDSIKQNWSTTGQELGKEFRQFWMPGMSRPGSPAVGSGGFNNSSSNDADSSSIMTGGGGRGRKRKSADLLTSPTTATPGGSDGRDARSPGAWSRLSIATGATGRNDRDFVAGYAMGLLGSVRGWMQRNRRNLMTSEEGQTEHGDLLSPRESPSSSEGEDNNGRKQKQHQHQQDQRANGDGASGSGSSVVDRLEASVADTEDAEAEEDADDQAAARGRKRGKVQA